MQERNFCALEDSFCDPHGQSRRQAASLKIGMRAHVVREVELVQMVYEGREPHVPDNTFDVTPLGEADSQEMVELGALTNPGPIGLRTHEIGDFIGVREDGRLIAMAGERMRFPGYSEVSDLPWLPDLRYRIEQHCDRLFRLGHFGQRIQRIRGRRAQTRK